MDRFKALNVIMNKHADAILHSSMDRFKDIKRYIQGNKMLFYIPVWIDLKCGVPCGAGVGSLFYIPVWIDLKAQRGKTVVC